MRNVVSFALAVAAALAFLSPLAAQEQNISVAQRAAAWGQVSAITIPDDGLPPVAGLAIGVEGGVNNGAGRRIQMTVKNPWGQYIARGVTYPGDPMPMPLGNFFYDGTTPVAGAVLLDGNTRSVLPSAAPIVAVEVFHIGPGVVEKTTAVIVPWNPYPQNPPDFKIGGESVQNQWYVLSLGGNISPGAVVAVGRNGIAEVKVNPAGTLVFVRPDALDYLPGPTTVTVCQSGLCATKQYDRQLPKPQPPSSLPGAPDKGD